MYKLFIVLCMYVLWLACKHLKILNVLYVKKNIFNFSFITLTTIYLTNYSAQIIQQFLETISKIKKKPLHV